MFKFNFLVNTLIVIGGYMKKFISLGLVFSMVLSLCFLFVGCNREVINVNVAETAQLTAENLFETFYNKESGAELPVANNENFYVEISSDVNTDLEVITINGAGHTANENTKYSVGQNNFVDVPSWRVVNGKLYVAVPTLYVEAKSGVATIIAGNKEFKVVVFDNADQLTIDSVSIVGTTEGATVNKTTNDSGKIVIEHTRTSGKSAVGWTLSLNGEVVPADKYVFTKKVMADSNTVSYGVDITSNAETTGYSSGLYNYWLNGSITEPVNRTIDYTVAIPGYGSVNFDVKITEIVPQA